MKGIVLGPDQGTHHSARGSLMTFKARAADTANAFSFMEREIPPGARLTPSHRHAGPESFYVLDGTLEFRIEDEVVEGRAGWFVLVPELVAHTFGNTSDHHGRQRILTRRSRSNHGAGGLSSPSSIRSMTQSCIGPGPVGQISRSSPTRSPSINVST